MSEWFQERYISRDEHQDVIEYYRRLVANLQHTIVDLRTQLDARVLDTIVEHGGRKAERPVRQAGQVDLADNVIEVDFRRPR
jgi:hypothetical protein